MHPWNKQCVVFSYQHFVHRELFDSKPNLYTSVLNVVGTEEVTTREQHADERIVA